MKKKFTFSAKNTIAPAAPASVWGKGCPGKGGKTTNATIGVAEKTEKENG